MLTTNVDVSDGLVNGARGEVVNPRRACARVTVLVLCVCVCVYMRRRPAGRVDRAATTSASVGTSKQRYSRVYLRLNVWSFEKASVQK